MANFAPEISRVADKSRTCQRENKRAHCRPAHEPPAQRAVDQGPKRHDAGRDTQNQRIPSNFLVRLNGVVGYVSHSFDDLLGRLTGQVHGDDGQPRDGQQAETCALDALLAADDSVREQPGPENNAEQGNVVENKCQWAAVVSVAVRVDSRSVAENSSNPSPCRESLAKRGTEARRDRCPASVGDFWKGLPGHTRPSLWGCPQGTVAALSFPAVVSLRNVEVLRQVKGCLERFGSNSGGF